MTEFTLELVSNASMDIYPNNTLASFTNFLPHEINLRGSWEVALLDISYPSRFKNIIDGRVFYHQAFNLSKANRLLLQKENEELKAKGIEVEDIVYDPTEDLIARRTLNVGPSPGFYGSIKETFDAINNNIERLNRSSNPELIISTEAVEDSAWLGNRTVSRNHASHDKFSKMCKITCHVDTITDKIRIGVNNGTTLEGADSHFNGVEIVGKDICAVMGLVGSRERKYFMKYLDLGTHLSYPFDLPVDIQRLHTVMMYCNIIQPSIVGDTSVPILGCLPISNRYKKNGEIDFTHVMNYRSFNLPLQYHNCLLYTSPSPRDS